MPDVFEVMADPISRNFLVRLAGGHAVGVLHSWVLQGWRSPDSVTDVSQTTWSNGDTESLNREEKIAYQYLVPPVNVYGGKITGTNDFAYFSRKPYHWTRGAERN